MNKRKAFGISRDLNEGISQTINAAKNNVGQLRYEVIPLSKIKFDPDNPRKLAISIQEIENETELTARDPLYERKKRELESLRSLATSIKKTGVRHAVEIYKDGINYRLISGERRVLGSILAGKVDIQARVLDTKPSEFDIRYLQWIENIEREDLNIWDRIQNVRQLVTAYAAQYEVEVTATVLKDILGCSLPHAMTYLAILKAPADIKALLIENAITNLEKAALLAKVQDSMLREKLVKKCLSENISLAGLKKIIQLEQKTEIEIKRLLVTKPRATKRVMLGDTDQVIVVKHLLELILKNNQTDKLHEILADIDWNNLASVSKGFQVVIKFLEYTLCE